MLNPKFIAKQVERHAADGMSARQIAKKIGVSQFAVNKIARENGIELTKQTPQIVHLDELTPEQRADYDTLQTNGDYTSIEAFRAVTAPRVKMKSWKGAVK